MQQISLFCGVEPLKINKKIRLIELFAGIGAQAKALENIGADFEHYRICEFDKYAVASYNAIHGTDFEVSDITKWHASDLGITEKDKYEYIMSYSFPCFVGDSLVLTDKGYKRIDEIKIGDMVLSHDNKYHKVLNVFNNGEKEVFNINGMEFDSIKATANHKFYTRERYRKGHLGIRTFRDPVWKELKDLTKNDYLGMAINQNSIVPKWDGIDFVWSDGRATRHKNELSELMQDENFWWVVGRYVADGWTRKQGGVVISSGYHKTAIIEERLNKVFKYNIANERTAAKYHIPLKEFQKFVTQFGVGAINKKIPGFVIDLPCDLLKAFLDGYMSGDGCFTENHCKATSISRELIYGIAQCVAKVYHRPCSVYKITRKPTCVIEGRTVNQNHSFDVAWKTQNNKQDNAFYENGYIWFPITSINQDGIETVYDIEVEDSHSFTVQNTIVHNCQSLSIAGKQAGMAKGSGTRSGLLWEVERLLEECNGNLPQILLMENVDAILFEKNRKHFFQWCNRLEEFGYKNYYQVLNAKDYGIPQNRNRCYMVSILGDYYFEFPKPIKLELRVKDMLEKEVPEKYYISKTMVDFFINNTIKQKEKGNGFTFNPTNGDGVAKAITSKAGSRMDDNFITDDVCIPCLTPDRLKKRQNGRRFKENGDSMFTLTAQDIHGVVISNPDIKQLGNISNKEGAFRIRKLMPIECFLLLGFTREDFFKVKAVGISDSQCYKQAGNSIVVKVLEAIFRNMNIKGVKRWQE